MDRSGLEALQFEPTWTPEGRTQSGFDSERSGEERGSLDPTLRAEIGTSHSEVLPEYPGVWLSPVERCVRVAEVPGSNPGTPIFGSPLSGALWLSCPDENRRFEPSAEVGRWSHRAYARDHRAQRDESGHPDS